VPEDGLHWWRRHGDPTLDSLVEQALVQGFSVRTAAARVAAARAQQRATASGNLPAVDIGAGASRQENTFAGIAPEMDFNLLNAGFDARWELDVFGRRARREEAAGARVEAALADQQAAHLVVAAEVARTYWKLRMTEARQALVAEALGIHRELEALASRRLEAGTGTRMDLLALVAAGERLAGTRPALAAQRTLAERQLELLLALEPGALTTRLATPVTQVEPALGVLPELLLTPAEVLAQRPDIRRAERRFAEAVAMRGAAEADRYPRFSFAVLMGLANTSIGSLFSAASESLLAGGQVVMPLFDAGRLRAAVDLSDAAVTEALVVYEQTSLSTLHEVESALTRLGEESRHVQRLDAEVVALTQRLDLSMRRHAVGVTDRVELLQASLDLNDARQRRVMADGRLRSQGVALMKALGVGLPASDETSQAPQSPGAGSRREP
jgi:NodT family efflux transporter outer membrane factor (OMF) lipoprotein